MAHSIFAIRIHHRRMMQIAHLQTLQNAQCIIFHARISEKGRGCSNHNIHILTYTFFKFCPDIY